MSLEAMRCLMPVCRAFCAEEWIGPKWPREVDLLVVGQRLVVKDHDRIAVDRVLDGIAVGGLQRTCKVDAGNLGHEIGMRRRDGDAHNRLLRL